MDLTLQCKCGAALMRKGVRDGGVYAPARSSTLNISTSGAALKCTACGVMTEIPFLKVEEALPDIPSRRTGRRILVRVRSNG